ncbi:glycoside hydrolase family 16 protein [Poronia punctata]|nr:glycoside hydrolase family 16 protein [Poronia punctata]
MMARSRHITALTLFVSALVTPCVAQLSTKCNPIKESCPPDPALGTAHTFYFNATPPDDTFTSTAAEIKFDENDGAMFTIAKKGQSATLESNFFFFFGRTEVHMKAARGQGVISSIVWGSDTLDEVDWEFKGGEEATVYSNYFGKGNELVPDPDIRGQDHKLPSGTIYDIHNYTSVWTKDKLEWHVDGQLVRTLVPDEANKGHNYPQTPMSLRMGSWVAGDPDRPQGTIDWAGGLADFSQAPFIMYVEKAHVEDFSSGKEYAYMDKSGSWESIKITEGNSTVSEIINKPPSKSLSEKWDDLPASTKTGIYIAAAAVGGLLFIALAFYYVKQRRRGRREAALAAKMQEEERVELERFKKEGRNPDTLNFDGAEYGGSTGKGGVLSTYSAVPDSPPGSSAGPPEKAWDPTGSNGLGSSAVTPLPLLHGEGKGASRNNSLVSPYRSESPGAAPTFPLPASPVDRSYSTSPHALSRMGSTGPQMGPYSDRVSSPAPSFHQARSPSSPAPNDVYGMTRLNSPGPMPNRGPGSPGPQGGYPTGDGRTGDHGGYWNNGGYR